MTALQRTRTRMHWGPGARRAEVQEAVVACRGCVACCCAGPLCLLQLLLLGVKVFIQPIILKVDGSAVGLCRGAGIKCAGERASTPLGLGGSVIVRWLAVRKRQNSRRSVWVMPSNHTSYARHSPTK